MQMHCAANVVRCISLFVHVHPHTLPQHFILFSSPNRFSSAPGGMGGEGASKYAFPHRFFAPAQCTPGKKLYVLRRNEMVWVWQCTYKWVQCAPTVSCAPHWTAWFCFARKSK